MGTLFNPQRRGECNPTCRRPSGERVCPRRGCVAGLSTTRSKPPPAVMRPRCLRTPCARIGFSLRSVARNEPLHHPLLFRFRFGFLLGRFLLHPVSVAARLLFTPAPVGQSVLAAGAPPARSGPVAERAARRLADLLLLLYRLLLHLLLLAGAARVGPPGSLYGTSFSCVGRCCISACICPAAPLFGGQLILN